MDTQASSRTASTINVILGIWLIVAPFILGTNSSTAVLWNDIILGIVVVVMAGTRLSNVQITWPSWVNVIAGLWLIIAPFVLGYSTMANARYEDIIVGIVVALVALWSALSVSTPVHR